MSARCCPSLVIDRRFGDALATQDDVAREVCDGLATVLSRAPAQRYSQEPEAYHAFKRGQHVWKNLLRRRLASSHRALSACHRPRSAVCARARGAGERLQLPGPVLPGQAQPGVCRRTASSRTRGGASIPRWVPHSSKWRSPSSAAIGTGMAPSRRSGAASRLIPPNAAAHVYYSWLLMLLGREDAALAEAERGHALAPSSRFVAGGPRADDVSRRPLRRGDRALQRMSALRPDVRVRVTSAWSVQPGQVEARRGDRGPRAGGHAEPSRAVLSGPPRALLCGVRPARAGARPR